MLKDQFELWGAVVSEAENGLAALKLLNSANCPDFKVAFLDMQMPNMDGAELAGQIKMLKQFEQMKLVMMTSMASRGDASYFATLGFDAYFPKPATTSDLFDTLALTLNTNHATQKGEPLITHDYLQSLSREGRQIHQKSKVQSTKAELSSEQLKKCRLLLVEDNRINQEVARHIMAEFGLNVDVASDGIEALQSLRLAAKDTPYDMILMDCQMPEMDGYQATKAIRNGEAGEINIHIPIIAMTANAMTGDKEKCLQAGMSDYLSKPIEPYSLKEKLLSWYDKQHPSANSTSSIINEEGAYNNSLLNKDNGTDTKNSELLIWDRRALLKRVSGNEIILVKLLALFFEEMPEVINSFSVAFNEHNKPITLSMAHKMKGISGNISALVLHEQIEMFEKSIVADDFNKEDFQRILDSYQSLQEELKVQSKH